MLVSLHEVTSKTLISLLCLVDSCKSLYKCANTAPLTENALNVSRSSNNSRYCKCTSNPDVSGSKKLPSKNNTYARICLVKSKSGKSM